MKVEQKVPLSQIQIEKARSLRSVGHTWDDCGAAVGVSYETIRRHLDPEYRARRNAAAARCGGIRRSGKASAANDELHRCTIAHRPPAEVLAERDARALAPRSLSALLLGDPPRGYSALDRRS